MGKPILLWDWDGTLVDSLKYKYEDVWDQVFPGNSKKQHEAIKYIKTPDGMGKNRYGIIRHVLSITSAPEVAQLDNDSLKNDPRIKSAANRYDRATKMYVYKNGLCKGARNVLKNLSNRGYHMYLISGGGTDDDLYQMLKYFNIEKFFRGIFGFGSSGAPLVCFGKRENFIRATEEEGNSKASDYIIIGDSLSDYLFAEDVGSHFVGIASKWNMWNDAVQNFPVVSDVTEVLNILKILQNK